MKTLDSINVGGAIIVVLVMIFVMLQKADKKESLEAQYIPVEQIDVNKVNKRYYDYVRP